MLIIIRGPSGSGKTTLAEYICEKDVGNYVHFEADMYFENIDGNYEFDPRKLKAAHKWCQNSVEGMLESGKSVVVANTFTRRSEMQPYLDMTDEVMVIRCTGEYDNTHGVPEKVVEKQRERMEDFEGEQFALLDKDTLYLFENKPVMAAMEA